MKKGFVAMPWVGSGNSNILPTETFTSEEADTNVNQSVHLLSSKNTKVLTNACLDWIKMKISEIKNSL